MKFQKRQVKASAGDYSLTILPLATAKTYLLENASLTDQDAIITQLIKGAVQTIESGLDFPIDTSGLVHQYYDSFPTDGVIPIWHRYIKEADLVVSYWDGSAYQVVSSSNYRIDISSAPPRVFLKASGTWPDLTSNDTYNMVKVSFKVDTAHSFYEELKAAVMTLTAARYENREANEIPKGVQAFIDKHKLHS